MAYVKTQGGQTVYPYSIGQLRKDNPNTSFPKSIPDATLAAYGVHSVTVLDAPAYDVSTQRIEQDTQPTQLEGVWTLGWTVLDKSQEELATEQAIQVVLQIAALKQLLADTDYVALSDYDKSKPEVLTQRQAWRDEIRTLEAQA